MSFASSVGSDAVTASSSPTNAPGIASGTLTPTALSSNVFFYLVSSPYPATSSLAISGNNVVADGNGNGYAIVTATLKDAGGGVAAGANVFFFRQPFGANFSPQLGKSLGDSTASTHLTSFYRGNKPRVARVNNFTLTKQTGFVAHAASCTTTQFIGGLPVVLLGSQAVAIARPTSTKAAPQIASLAMGALVTKASSLPCKTPISVTRRRWTIPTAPRTARRG